MAVGDDGVGTLAVEIGFRIGDADCLGTEQKLRGKLLVLVEDARCETEVTEDGALEEVATGRTLDVVVAHVVGTAVELLILIGLVLLARVGEVEDHHLGMAEADQVDAVFVGSLYEEVVAIDKLQVFASGHLDARVPGFAETFVLLTHVDDVPAVCQQVVHRTCLRAVIDDDDLAFYGAQGEGHDTVDTLAQHLDRQVVVGQDKTDQRLLHIL